MRAVVSGPTGEREGASAIDEVVQELCAIERRAGIDRVLEIGRLILERFFDGNPALWRDRRRNKEASIRRLAQRADCPYCKSALNEAVAVYVAVAEMPCVRSFGHVRSSHVAAALQLSRDEMVEVLHVAENERWSVRELKAHVVKQKASATVDERRALDVGVQAHRNDEYQVLCALREAMAELRAGVVRVKALSAVSDVSHTVLKELDSDVSELAAALRALLRRQGDMPIPKDRR